MLCEKGVIAGEQSSRNWGWCRSMGRDPREILFIVENLRLWRGLNERIGSEIGYRQRGTLYIARTSRPTPSVRHGFHMPGSTASIPSCCAAHIPSSGSILRLIPIPDLPKRHPFVREAPSQPDPMVSMGAQQ
jgi:FAD dependent oxidoreductase